MRQSEPIPEIETERLLLRGWRDEDVAVMAAIGSDPEVASWLGPFEPSEMRGRMEVWSEHWQRHGFGQWLVEEKVSGEVVGRVGLVHHGDWTASGHDAEVGWMLARRAWGNGYATEGARAVLAWARTQGQLRQIISITRPDNVRSQKVMERLGMVRAGQTHWRGFDQVWYELDLVERP